MIKSCERAREIVNNYCDEIRRLGRSAQDPEAIRMAFFHIYYCWNFDNKCGGLWYRLNKNEKHPDIGYWIENWTYDPAARFTITSINLCRNPGN